MTQITTRFSWSILGIAPRTDDHLFILYKLFPQFINISSQFFLIESKSPILVAFNLTSFCFHLGLTLNSSQNFLPILLYQPTSFFFFSPLRYPPLCKRHFELRPYRSFVPVVVIPYIMDLIQSTNYFLT